jgi:addiction module RelE/StbE family toxin
MSKEYEIFYLQTAERDLYEIFDYIKKDRPSAASSLLEKIDKAISHLSMNPEMGVVPGDTRLRNLGYRILRVEKYLVFYVVKEKSVQIRRIIHGARKYEFLL